MKTKSYVMLISIILLSIFPKTLLSSAFPMDPLTSEIEFPINTENFHQTIGLNDEYEIFGNLKYNFTFNETNHIYSIKYEIDNHTISNSSYSLHSWMIGIREKDFYINIQNHNITTFIEANNSGINYIDMLISEKSLTSLMYGIFFSYKGEYPGMTMLEPFVEKYLIDNSELTRVQGNDIFFELDDIEQMKGLTYFQINQLAFTISYNLKQTGLTDPEWNWSVKLEELNFNTNETFPEVGFYLSYNFNNPGTLPGIGVRESQLELFPTLENPGSQYIDQFKLEQFEEYSAYEIDNFEIMINVDGLPNFQIFFGITHTIWENTSVYYLIGFGGLAIGITIIIMLIKKNSPKN